MIETLPSSIYSIVLILSALIPAIVLLVTIYRMDKIEKEPHELLLKLFMVGVFSAVPAILLEMVADNVIIPMLPLRNEYVYLIAVAISVGLIEEACKYFFLYYYTWHRPEFNYSFDGVVYAVFVSLGFAAIENVFYVFQYGLSVALMRAFLAIPGHTAFAIFMGSFYGRAKVCYVRGNDSGKTLNLILAYIVAVALHAFYDATALIGNPYALTLFVAFVVMMYFIVFKKVKRESIGDESIF